MISKIKNLFFQSQDMADIEEEIDLKTFLERVSEKLHFKAKNCKEI